MEKYYIEYSVKGKNFTSNKLSTEHFTVEKSECGNRTVLNLHANEPIAIQRFQIILPYSFKNENRIFVNGINLAYDAKCKGTLKAENTRKPKADTNKQDVADSPQAVKADTQTEVQEKPKRTTKKKSTKTSN